MNIAEALERGSPWPVMTDLAQIDPRVVLEGLRPGQVRAIPPNAWQPINLAAAHLPPWEAARRLLEGDDA